MHLSRRTLLAASSVAAAISLPSMVRSQTVPRKTGSDIFYIAELELPQSALDDFITWFAHRHCPDLFKAGFYTAACYRGIEGEYTILDAYQATTWDVFLSPGYAARAKDPYLSVLSPVRRNDNTVYSYAALPADVAGDPLAPIDSDWISLLRFEGSSKTDDALVKALVSQEIPRLKSLGAGTVRLVRRTKDWPAGKLTSRPRCGLVAEWRSSPPPLSDLLAGLQPHVRDQLDMTSGFVGNRAVPWPDRAHLRR